MLTAAQIREFDRNGCLIGGRVTRFVKSGQHPMKKFIELDDDAPMRDAGEHFPHVVRGGRAVPPPERIQI